MPIFAFDAPQFSFSSIWRRDNMQHGLKRSSLGYNWNMFSFPPFFNIQIILICWIDWQSVHCAHRLTIWCFCMPTQNKNRSFFYAFIINVFPRYWRQIRWRILLTKKHSCKQNEQSKTIDIFLLMHAQPFSVYCLCADPNRLTWWKKRCLHVNSWHFIWMVFFRSFWT